MAKVINFLELINNEDPDDNLQLDVEDFHQPVSDKHGHNTRCQFRVLKQMKAMLMEIVQTKQFPYRSESDLLRHATVRHLRWLTDQGYLGANTIFTIDAITEIEREDELHQAFLQSIEKMQERYDYHRRHGSHEHNRKKIEKIKELVDKLPDSNPWKERYKEEMINRFPEEGDLWTD